MTEIEYREELIAQYKSSVALVARINAFLNAPARGLGLCHEKVQSMYVLGGRTSVCEWSNPIGLPVSIVPCIRQVLLSLRADAEAKMEKMVQALQSPERINFYADTNGSFDLGAMLKLSQATVMTWENPDGVKK